MTFPWEVTTVSGEDTLLETPLLLPASLTATLSGCTWPPTRWTALRVARGALDASGSDPRSLPRVPVGRARPRPAPVPGQQGSGASQTAILLWRRRGPALRTSERKRHQALLCCAASVVLGPG